MSTQSVIADVVAERRRQIEVEGWSLNRDDRYDGGALALAAASYASMSVFGDEFPESLTPPATWPWARQWWKPCARRKMLIKAAALIVAEIERLDRAHG